MSAIGEFYLARLAEDEAAELGQTHIMFRVGGEQTNHRGSPRVLADIAAKRKIVELHEQWPTLVESAPKLVRVDASDPDSVAFKMTQQIMWATEQEYRNRFGDEPPTSPIMRALVSVYADHPDFQETWR